MSPQKLQIVPVFKLFYVLTKKNPQGFLWLQVDYRNIEKVLILGYSGDKSDLEDIGISITKYESDYEGTYKNKHN